MRNPARLLICCQKREATNAQIDLPQAMTDILSCMSPVRCVDANGPLEMRVIRNQYHQKLAKRPFLILKVKTEGATHRGTEN